MKARLAAKDRHPSAPALLLGAMLVDTFGSGLVAPFELLFGHVVVDLPLIQTGLIISIATGLAIVVGPIAGALVDRHGAVRVAVGANLLSASGTTGLLFAREPLAFGLATFAIAAGARGFWGAYAPLVATFTDDDRLEALLGRVRGTRYVGIALGGAIAALALLPGIQVGLRLVLALNALSYVAAITFLLAARRRLAAAAGLLGAPNRSVGVERPLAARATSVGYSTAIRDRANTVLAAMNVLDTLIMTVPFLALPVFVLDILELPSWLPGVLSLVATISVVVPLFLIGRFTAGRRRLRVLATAAAVWAAALALFAASAWDPPRAALLLSVAVIILGIGTAVYEPTSDALPLALAGPGLAGRYTAVHQLAWGVAGTIAPVLASVLLATSPDLLWVSLASLAALTAAGYFALSGPLGPRAGVVGVRPFKHAA